MAQPDKYERFLAQTHRCFYRVCAWTHDLSAAMSTWFLTTLCRVLAKFPWSCQFSVILAVLGLVSLYAGVIAGEWVVQAVRLRAEHLLILEKAGILGSFSQFAVLLTVLGVFYLLLAVPISFIRKRVSLYLLKGGGASFCILWLYMLFFVVRVPAILYAENAQIFPDSARNELWIRGFILWLPFMLLSLLAILLLLLRGVRNFYAAEAGTKVLLGDKILANLQSHGKDPSFRTSFYWAVTLHCLAIALPLLVARGCLMEAYAVPRGTGQQIIHKVVIKRIKKKKKKKLVLNLNSPILYYVPDLDDSKIVQELDQETMDTYQATSLKSGLGKGGAGKGGWPHGMENARVRFIRLKYNGGDWDQDMGKGADYNFLIKFSQLTGFKVAAKTEAIHVYQLRRFPKHRGPPFVFLTGGKKGSINVSSKEIRTLRWYCLEEGGMIFADNGGGSFNHHFRSLMRRTFPDLEWVDIANDDIIFRRPFPFPHGAPRFWHHSGDRALGLKHNGRWIVFYHQGDVNDAWKTGHSGATEYVADQAYRLGVNIVNYAFNQYMNIHFGD